MTRPVFATYLLHLLLLGSSEVPGAPIVQCPPRAPARRTVTFDEVWRAGGDESEEFLFGVVSQVVSDAQGRVYLLDKQLQQIHRFGRDGTYEGMIVRRGEGPGEIDHVYHLEYWPPDRLGLVRSLPGRVTEVDLDGNYVREVHLYADPARETEMVGMLSSAPRRGDVILARGSRPFADGDPGAEENVLASLDAEGNVIAVLFSRSHVRHDFRKPKIVIEELDYFFPGSRHALAPDGSAFVAPERNEYRIERRAPQGELLLTIEREFTAPPRTEAQIEAVKNQYAFAASPGMKLPDIVYEIEPSAPPIRGVQIVRDQLWVTLEIDDADLPGGCLARYAVHSLDGELLEERDVVLPFDRERDLVRMLEDGRIVRIANYQDAARSARAGRNIQIGERKPGQEDLVMDAEELEVIVYEPGEVSTRPGS